MKKPQIKYRVWIPISKEFRYWGIGAGIFEAAANHVFTGPPTGSPHIDLKYCAENSEPIMPFTDENKKEIYAGDIISIENNISTFPANAYVVEWHKTGTYVLRQVAVLKFEEVEKDNPSLIIDVKIKKKYGDIAPITDISNGNYLGNIHQNPELL